MQKDSRRFIIKIESPGAVSVDTLSKKLQAAQQVLLNVGSATAGGGRRGPYSAEVLQACTLFFVKSKPGSLEVITELPPKSVLFKEMDLGEESLRNTDKTLQAIQQKDRKAIEELYPDFGQRSRVVKSIARLLPEEDAEYEVLITTDKTLNRLQSSIRETLEPLIIEPVELPEQVIKILTGTLYLIEVATGKHQIGVIVNNRHIPCYYAPDDEVIVRDLIPGSLVEVKGRATLNNRGDVEQIEEVIDITMVQPIIPLNWTRVDYGNRRFVLNEQIQIQQDFRGSMWICEFKPLGILGYGESRHEAVNSLRRDFAICWDNIAQEDDKNLTLDAQELKQKLRGLVKEVVSLS